MRIDACQSLDSFAIFGIDPQRFLIILACLVKKFDFLTCIGGLLVLGFPFLDDCQGDDRAGQRGPFAAFRRFR